VITLSVLGHGRQRCLSRYRPRRRDRPAPVRPGPSGPGPPGCGALPWSGLL